MANQPDVQDIITQLFTKPARLVLALTLWGEARGETVAGAVAVAWVIVNRARQRKQTMQLVCLWPHQFSCWPPYNGDTNEHKVIELARAVLAGQPIADKPWAQCLRLADQVLVGALPDPTGGADHYMTVDLYQQVKRTNAPAGARWCLQMTPTVTIGRHQFFRSRPS